MIKARKPKKLILIEKKSSMNWPTIISLIAIGIAGLSLILTLRQNAIVANHYRLTVQPHLFFELHYPITQITVRNAGFGPAQIKAVHFSLKDDSVVARSVDEFKQYIDDTRPADSTIIKTLHAQPTQIVIQAQGEAQIYRRDFENEELDGKIDAFWKQYKLKIWYSSIYGESYYAEFNR